MHLVVGDVAIVAEIHRVDDFIIPVGLVAIKISGLPTVTCKVLGQACSPEPNQDMDVPE